MLLFRERWTSKLVHMQDVFGKLPEAVVFLRCASDRRVENSARVVAERNLCQWRSGG